MSFGSNVLFYRKKYKITQEELAEKLEVTRQTVSRWETDSAFPEMEKILILCELFHTDMETLVRGDAETQVTAEDHANMAAYNRHMNIFSVLIASGVGIILLGLAAMMFIYSAATSEAKDVYERTGTIVFLCFVTVAVALFVTSGVGHVNFMRENPKAEVYPKEQSKKFFKKLPYLISGGIAIILIGVIMLLAIGWQGEAVPSDSVDREAVELLSVGIFFCLLTVGVWLLVFSGIQADKYNVKNYNRECRREGYASGAEDEEPETKGERIENAICGVIMMTATAAYLLMGFVWNFWHPGWVIFPVGGILCGVVSVICKAIGGRK